jgi:ribonuclease HI
MSRRELLTLFTDASWQPRTSTGSGAYWAKRSERESVKAGFVLRSPVVSSNEAEMKAIANSLFLLLRDGYLERQMHVLIQSDSSHCVGVLNRKIATCKEQTVVDFIVKLAKENEFSFTARHVKGHTSGGGRSWVNRECDRLARLHGGL